MNAVRFGWFLARCATLGVSWWFVSLEDNPVVRLEAALGLSPSPLERLLDIKGPFSGMTEGFHRLAHGRLGAAIEANVMTPVVATALIGCLVCGYRPRIRGKNDEALCFVAIVTSAILVNMYN